jgi:hypothetical protein
VFDRVRINPRMAAHERLVFRWFQRDGVHSGLW